MTRADLNAWLSRLGLTKATYAVLLGTSAQSVARHGNTRRIPAAGYSVLEAWGIMTEDQRAAWLQLRRAASGQG